MSSYARVRRVTDLTQPLVNAQAEALLRAAGFLSEESEDDPDALLEWIWRLLYDGPPTWTFDERWDLMMQPENVRLRNTPGGILAQASCRSIAAAKGDTMARGKKAQAQPTNVSTATAPAVAPTVPTVEALTAMVAAMQANLAQLALGQTHPAALATVAAATAPSASSLKAAQYEAAKAAKQAVLATLPKADHSQAAGGVFTIRLAKTGNTKNSVLYSEIVGGKPVEDFSQGLMGNVHVRRETLAAAGLLATMITKRGKGKGKAIEVADGPVEIEITVNLRPSAR